MCVGRGSGGEIWLHGGDIGGELAAVAQPPNHADDGLAFLIAFYDEAGSTPNDAREMSASMA